MVKREQIVRGNKGVFILCSDATNGRIFYRKDGSKTWKRFKGPSSDHMRLKLTVGKRGLFCLCGDGKSGSLWFRRFKANSSWVRYQGPSTR
jgi:hypothetical protein